MKYLLSLALFPLVLFPMVSQVTYDEEELDFLERHIPELAVLALRLAYWEALASGSCVLVVKDGALMEVAPDGSEKIIKELPKWISITPGKYMRIIIEMEEDVK